ncbi:MAG: HEAT repeat domain-containing protein [Candidatus Micrarchaeota archaeon]
MTPPHRKKTPSYDSKSQAKLKIADDGESDHIDRLVALTFDENPKVRKKVAHELSEMGDDPRALLALLELSSDKDDNVSSIAKKGLGAFKTEDEEALTSLEKFFEEARKEKTIISEENFQKTKNKLMPSLEKLFSGREGARKKLMPSLLKHFSQAAAASGEYDEESEDKEDGKSSVPSLHYAQLSKTIIDSAEKEVGIPARMQNPEKLRKTAPASHAYAKSPGKADVEDAANFPLPDSLQHRLYSPVASIPLLADELTPEGEFEKEEILPISYLDYYKLAYSMAINPSVKSSDLKKEKTRLIKETKKNIELAFKVAVARAHQEGIEGFTGLKPGMKKITTLPLEVLDHHITTFPKGKKKTIEMSRLLLSDGKKSMPLYVEPERAHGIKAGDLISLRNAYVDYLINKKTDDASPGELVFKLSKTGQMIITK